MALRPNVTVQTAAPMRRVLRRPRHDFQIRTRPWQIQPFMIAPVLPGETMKNLLLQARVVTDPIKSPIIGWWTEHYFFYVKHRDLDARDTLVDMMLDPSEDLTSLEEAADAKYYHYAGTVNWPELCLKRIVEEYFRNDGEVWNTWTLDGVPLAAAQPRKSNWLDSAILRDAYVVSDPNIDLNASGATTASEVERAMHMWQQARALGMVEMDYEDYLATYGVRTAPAELHVPELIRYCRSWTYPANTINPTDGSPKSACSWAIAERADKDRYFSEPGFIVGVNVTRPKVYIRNVDGHATSMLREAIAWLPAMLHGMLEHSIRQFAATEGPLQTLVTDTDGYIVDVRDLFLYGDQFLNFALSATDANIVDLPEQAALTNKHYADSADADALFVSASPANQIRQDGVVTLAIAGNQRDVT